MKKIYSILLFIALVCCGTVRAEQLNEGFEGTTFAPDGWKVETTKGTVNWASSTSKKHDGSKSALAKYGPSTGNDTYLITPQLAPQNGESLSFWLYAEYSSYQTTIQVEVSTTDNAAASFSKVLETYVSCSTGDNTFSTTWKNFTIDLSDYDGQNIYIAFHAIDADGNNIYLDDVTGVTLKPESCPVTGAPAATAKTSTTATIEWTVGASETAWNLQYKKASETDWSASIAVATTPSYELTGLASGTTYKVRVQANCGDETSDWKEGEAFDTECATATLPFEPVFANGVVPTCWTASEWASSWSGKWYTYSVSSTTYGLQYQASTSSAGATIQTPEIELSEAAILTFKFTNYYSGRRVTSSVIISDGTTEETVALADATSTSLEDRTIDLTNVNGTDFTGKSVKITFKGTKSSSSTGYLKIANIRVDVKPCPLPGVPAASEITATSAVLTWAQAESVEDYQFCCVRKGEAPVFGVAQKLLTVTLDTLQANTEYDFYVRTYCGVSDQSEAKSVSFATPKSCSVPTDFVADNIQAHSAQFTWTSSASAFKFHYKAEGDEYYSADYDLESGSILNGLQPTTTYYAQVKAVCGTDDESDWTEAISFTTTCPASVSAPIAWTFEDQTANATPKCWEIGGTSETLTSNPAYFWGVYSYSSNKSLRMYNYGIKAGTAFINTPAIVLPDKAQELVFDYSNKANCGAFTVKISKDNGANWTDLQSFDESGSTDSSNPGEFTEATISLADFVGETVILQFFATANWSQGAIYVDNIDIHDAPSCVKPANLQVSNIKAEGATFSWESDATEFEYQYKYASLSIYKSDKTNGKDVTFNGSLNENITYDFRVRAICAEGDTSEWTSTQFTTLCAVKTLPLEEGFESSTSVPACWETTGSWTISSEEHTGTGSTQSARFYATAAGDLVTPEIKLTDEPSLTFDYKSSSATGAVYMVKGTEETLIANLTTTSSWSRVNSSLPAASVGDTIRILFRGNQSGKFSLYLDNFKLVVRPCAVPSDVNAAVSTDAATITWTSDAPKFTVKHGEKGAEWTEIKDVTENSLAINGLVLGKEYGVIVMAHCSDTRESEWTDTVWFTPACPVPSNIVLSNRSYNGITVSWTAGGAETSWNVQVKQEPANWLTPAANVTEPTYTFTGLWPDIVSKIRVQAGCDGEWIESEEFTLVYTAPSNLQCTTTDNAVTISWDAVADAQKYAYAVVRDASKVTEADFVETTETSATVDTLQAKTLYEVVVRSMYADDGEKYSNWWNGYTTTIAPKDLEVIELTATSAKISWDDNGSAALITEFALDTAAELDWHNTIMLPLVLDELTPNTAYTYYLRHVYPNDSTSESVAGTFRTKCENSAMPFDENFNELSSLNDNCWDDGGSGATYDFKWALSAAGQNDSKCAYFYCESAAGNTRELATPVIAIDDEAVLKFWFKNLGTGEFRVLIGAEDVAERDTLVKNLVAADWTKQEIELDAKFVGKNVQLFFLGTTTGKSGNIYLDSVTVTAKPACVVPTGLTTFDETFEGATFSWTAGGSETTWNLRYKAADAEDWTSIAAANPQMLYGLNTGVQYTVQVQATCDDTEKSEWSDAITFTPQYLAPWDVAAADVTTSSAKISWTARSGELAWTLQYGKVGGTLHEINVTDNPFVLTDLDAGTKYEARIVAGVAPNAAYSDYVTFTTECAVIAELPWSENFSNFTANTVPNCWIVKNANGDGQATLVAGESMYVTTDGNALHFNGNYTQDTAFAILPEFADLSNAQITFKHVSEFVGAGKFAFGYFVGDDFTSLLAIDGVYPAATINPFVLPALPDGARLAFAFKMENTNTTNYAILIDNILIEKKPECAIPTNLTVHSITAEGASFAFDSDAEKFNYMIRKAGEEWSAPIEINSNGFWLGLDANTEYEFQVQAVCAGVADPSSWSEVVSFKTLCEVEAMPFYEGFEGGVPECWSAEGSWITDEYIAHEGKSLRFNAKNNSGSLSTPKIEITEADAVLIYYFRNTYGGTNHVGGSVTIKAGSQVLDSAFVDSKGESLERREISLADFADLNVTITFNVQSVNATASVFIDSVRVVSKPCATPKNVQVEAGNGSAIVTWDPSEEEETAWKLTWGEKESMSWTGTYDPVTETTFEITGLENGVEYGVQVYSFCDEAHTSSHTEVVYFTPSEPTGMENTNAKDNAVKFVENGVLYILRDGVIYNAQGARVNK